MSIYGVTDHDLENLYHSYVMREDQDPRVTEILTEAMIKRGLLSRA